MNINRKKPIEYKFINIRNDEGIVGYGGLTLKNWPIKGRFRLGDGAVSRTRHHVPTDIKLQVVTNKEVILVDAPDKSWCKYVYGGYKR